MLFQTMSGLTVSQRLRLDELEKKLSRDDVELLHDTFAIHGRDEAVVQELQDDLNNLRQEVESASDELDYCVHDLKKTKAFITKLCKDDEALAANKELKEIVDDFENTIYSLDEIDLRIW